MKTVRLSTWERIQLLQCIPPTSPILDLPKHLRVMKLLDLTAEERQKVGFAVAPNGSMKWTNTEHLFTIAFEDADFDHTMKLINARKSWLTTELTMQLIGKMKDVEAGE